jgi:hypothetical protein
MAPGDLSLRDSPRVINPPSRVGVGSDYKEAGFGVAFVDGAVWILSDEVPYVTVSKLFTVAGAVKWDREELLGPFALRKLEAIEN